jgi:hypothetical protein
MPSDETDHPQPQSGRQIRVDVTGFVTSTTGARGDFAFLVCPPQSADYLLCRGLGEQVDLRLAYC